MSNLPLCGWNVPHFPIMSCIVLWDSQFWLQSVNFSQNNMVVGSTEFVVMGYNNDCNTPVLYFLYS